MKEEQAYKECLEITKREAKNFYFGISLLPPPKRKALSALYAIARIMDDIADGDAKEATKLAELDELSGKIKDLEQGKTDRFSDSAPLWGVHYGAKQFPIPISGLYELVEGCRRDAIGQTEYETYEDMLEYCKLVAGSVGRLSLGVFGSGNNQEINQVDLDKMADDLGLALQITNILRDILEDKEMGRIYLPREDLERFNISEDFSGSQEDKKSLVLFEADRAMEWFKKGFELLNYLDRRSFACTAAMSGIYFNLLQKIRRQPEVVFQKRVSLSTNKKLRVVMRSLCKVKPAKI